jgi:uncharacterized protein YacL
MMLFRCALAFCAAAVGSFLFWGLFRTAPLAAAGGLAGLVLAAVAMLIEHKVKKIPLKVVVGGVAGFAAGLVLANLSSFALLFCYPGNALISFTIYLMLNVLLGFLGLTIGAGKADELVRTRSGALRGADGNQNFKVMDTSAIIDGRIADIFETGFVEGTLIIPQFVLQELLYIADSSDSLRRVRGKRGLDILNKIQKQVDVEVRIIDQDFPKIKEVDAKLVALAKKMEAKIITNDFNLNKVAELQGVPVLNVNQLATSLRPVVLPGELMNVFIQREGKEQGQGVAYLDDGTMVVVENGRRFMGKSADVTVTSVLQTTAGRMIFTELKSRKSSDNASNSDR